MHDTPDGMSIADWIRARFGIEDTDELQAVLADPTEMLALLDVADAAKRDEALDTKPHAAHLV